MRQRPRTAAPARKSVRQNNRGPRILLIVLIVVLIAIIAIIAHACSSSSGTQVDTPDNQIVGTGDTQAAQQSDDIVMTLLGDEDTQVLVGESYLEAGCHAVDTAAKTDVTASVTTSGEVDTSTPGDYTVTYTATNASGATNTRTRTVHVVEQMDADQNGIPVMMYHYVYTDDDQPEELNGNYLHADKLKAQLDWLSENDYYYPSYGELVAYVKGEHTLPAKSIILTFDDAEDGFLKHGVPLFVEHKIPATSFIIGDRPETPDKLFGYANEYVCFQSHSYSLHTAGTSGMGQGGKIYDLNHEELVDDAKKMQELLGGYVSMAYPFGDVSDEAPAAFNEAGVICAFTVQYGNACKGDDPMRLSRLRVFAESPLESWIYQVENGD